MKKPANLDGAIDTYIELSIEYGNTLCESEKSTRPDKCFDEIQEVFQYIKSRGNVGLGKLAELLQHQNESVRLWSSFHLLDYPEYESLPVLESIKESGSLISLVAEVTFDQWRNK